MPAKGNGDNALHCFRRIQKHNKKSMKHVMFLLAFVIMQWQGNAQLSITGTILDTEGNALEGAHISIRNTYLGTSTDHKGFYQFPGLKPGVYTVAVSFVGYAAAETTINLDGSRQLDFTLKETALIGEEVVVSAVRATQKTPATFSLVTGENLKHENLGKDLPYLIATEPSVVTTSDAGTGIGYTGVRIRGSDMTRINVTINGIPVNDPESHNVFWVDLPDIAGSVNSLQIQRGVGSSTNGAGAFGASINIETDALRSDPYGEISASVGSFNTLKSALKFGTGLIHDHWYLDGRASRIISDGYVDRAGASLKSFFLQGGYLGEKTMIKAVMFSGMEKTYQSWYGIDATTLDTARTFNWAGAIFIDDGSISYYNNQVDQYQQDYYQLHISRQLNRSLNISLAGHYTRGKGYYEEYMQDQPLADYGLPNLYFGRDSIVTPDTITYFYHDSVTATDLIRRRWLDNDFYGTTFSLHYSGEITDLIFGGSFNKYDHARHFGDVIWAEFAGPSSFNQVYYDNTAFKTDGNTYVKVILNPVKSLSLYGDLQYRYIRYHVSGYEPDSQLTAIDETFHFFNPKAGIAYTADDLGTVYISYSVAHKEPNRDDFIDAVPGEKPVHETMYNLEAGIRKKAAAWSFAGNIYLMNYRNQLVLTGEINDVGAFIRRNAGKSFRAGVELSGDCRLGSHLLLNGNISLSRNKTDYKQIGADNTIRSYNNTDISFSPWLVGFFQVSFMPVKELVINFSGKYVSKQYLDNTQNQALTLDAYLLNDLGFGYKLRLSFMREVELNLKINNLFNRLYESNGYVYDGIPYYYPQAGINFQAGITCRL
jgi:iron complex outermembrane recepter protein